MLAFFLFSFFKSREFLLPIPCWLRFYAGSFSYTSRTGFILFFYLGSFSYTSRACFIFLWGVSLTHPMLASFISGVGFSYTSHTGFIFYLGSFSYTSHACFLCVEFLLHIPCWLLFFLSLMWGETQVYTSRAGFIFIWGVSLTHPMLISFFYCGKFLLHIPYWLCFYLGSFSYTSHACISFLWGVSLTHPMLASFHFFFFSFFSFSLGSFSNTCRAGLIYLILFFTGFI